jgi:hypothetical protein
MVWIIKAQAFTLQANLQPSFAAARVRGRAGGSSAAGSGAAGRQAAELGLCMSFLLRRSPAMRAGRCTEEHTAEPGSPGRCRALWKTMRPAPAFLLKNRFRGTFMISWIVSSLS